MSELIWDSSALLMVINQEAGWERWAGLLPRGGISTVNLSEVVAKLAERGANLDEIRPLLDRLALEVHPFTLEQAHSAGALRTVTRDQGLSLGDRACLALARERRVPALTADRSWSRLVEPGVEIRLAR